MKTLEEDFPNVQPIREAKVNGVYAKLMRARLDLQGRKLNKSGHNKFAGYQYFELGDFLPVVQEIFGQLGLCGIVSYTADTASLTICDTENGQSIVITSPMGSAALKGCHEVQNIGAVETYQRRYLWVMAMEIVEHDALDATTGNADSKSPPKRESAKSEAMSEWDKLDTPTKEWMVNEAMAITVMLNDGDIEGSVNHLEGLGMDVDYKIAFWSRLDSKQRSAIKKFQSEKYAKKETQ